MTITKLLTGAAVAALLAGAAQAQDVTIGAGDVAATNTFASELDLDNIPAVDQPAGDLVLDVDFSTDPYAGLGAADDVDFTVSLAGFAFSSVVTSANFVDTGVGTECSFAIQSGGGIGSTSVTFRSDDAINTCVGSAVVTLPVRLTASAASATWATTLVGPGSAIDGDTFADMVDQDQAFEITLAATDAELRFEENFSRFTGGIGGDDNADIGTVGFTNNGVLGAPGAWTNLLPASVFDDGNSFVLNFTNSSGIASATVGGTPCVLAGNTCTLSAIDAADLIAGLGVVNIVSEDDDTMPIAAQQLTGDVTLAAALETYQTVADVSDDLGLITRANTIAVGGAAVFDWVRIGTGGTESNFRASFIDPDNAASITSVIVDVAEGNGVSGDVNGQIVLLPGDADTGFRIQGATITFNSRALGNASGEAGNADITGISMEFDPGVSDASGELATIDVRRQFINRTPGTFVATPGLGSDAP